MTETNPDSKYLVETPTNYADAERTLFELPSEETIHVHVPLESTGTASTIGGRLSLYLATLDKEVLEDALTHTLQAIDGDYSDGPSFHVGLNEPVESITWYPIEIDIEGISSADARAITNALTRLLTSTTEPLVTALHHTCTDVLAEQPRIVTTLNYEDGGASPGVQWHADTDRERKP